MFSTSSAALILGLATLLPHFTTAIIPPTHLSRRAADAQSALVLDPSQLSTNSEKNGQEAGAEAGQVPSSTSVNNFINFCLGENTVLTNGLQTKTGSCNPTIMGRIAATDRLPSSKFTFPVNLQTIPALTPFTIKMQIKNLATGSFVNAKQNYYAAPCQVDASGTVIGHSHVVIEKIDSLASTTVTDPNIFAFFKGLNAAAVGGLLTADVVGGLEAGAYRMASINACANHQPVLGAVAQHGSFDDGVYFTVADGAAGSSSAIAKTGTASIATGTAKASASASASISLSVKATGTAKASSVSASASVKATATSAVVSSSKAAAASASAKVASSSVIAKSAASAISSAISKVSSVEAKSTASAAAASASASVKA